MNHRLGTLVLVAVVVLSAASGFAQSAVKSKTLVINGRRGEATIYVIDGKPFVAVEAIARIGEAQVTAQGDEIIVTFPPSPGSSETAGASTHNMTASFISEAIRCLSSLKEWHTALAQAIQRGVPGDGSRLIIFHDRAAERLRLANAAAAGDSDRSAAQLLNNHFNQVDTWTRKLVKERQSMSTGNYSLTPNALDNDSDYQRLANCSTSLGAMLSVGRYEDKSECH